MNRVQLEVEIAELVQRPQDVRSRKGKAIDRVVAALDRGELRVCEPRGGEWVTHAWIKQAIVLYFARYRSQELVLNKIAWPEPRLVFYDKVPTKQNYRQLGARCVPPGVARYGSFLGPGSILMPAYVNIGAYVGAGSMVDTWATVGSCAQIGEGVHLSGGVGIGGVLEPPQAQPVIVEDGAFIGSRCVLVEGVRVRRQAVVGAGVVLTASTPVIDVRGSTPQTSKGNVPERAVVIPGTLPKEFAAGTYGAPCALIIGTRSEATDRKTSLNAALRDYEIAP